jgi:DNA-binding GntR family transcriptional regulator
MARVIAARRVSSRREPALAGWFSPTYRRYSPARMRQSMRQHRELVDALRAGDPAWAEAVMRVHILSARPALLDTADDAAGT